MAAEVLLDTNGWIALLNAGESLHQQAVTLWRELLTSQHNFVVSDWVIAETGNGLARSKKTHAFPDAVKRLLASSRAEIVFVDLALMQDAIDFYATHDDKSWGLVDCVSFLLMTRRGMTDAFTSDRHFQQAGFHPLLAVS